MGRVLERIQVAEKALATLKELAFLEDPSPVERDAAIQRFEYTFEAFWKALQAYLREKEGPRGKPQGSYPPGPGGGSTQGRGSPPGLGHGGRPQPHGPHLQRAPGPGHLPAASGLRQAHGAGFGEVAKMKAIRYSRYEGGLEELSPRRS